MHCFFAGSLGVPVWEICQPVGICEDLAALSSDHVSGPGLWNMVFCSGVGMRPVPAHAAVVLHLLAHPAQEAALQPAAILIRGINTSEMSRA